VSAPCLGAGELAALAARDAAAEPAGDAGAAAHLGECLACRRELAEQRALLALLARAPAAWPALRPARRAALGAELLARADALPAPAAGARRPRRASWWVAAGAAVAAAAALALWIEARDRGAASPAAIAAARAPAAGAAAPAPAPPEVRRGEAPTAAPLPPAAAVASAGQRPAQFSRARYGGRDLVQLVDGAIAIDAPADPGAPAVEVRGAAAGEAPEVRVRQGRVAVVARRGAIQSVAVFAGAAEIAHGGRRQIVQAGAVWEAPAAAAPGPRAAAAAPRSAAGAPDARAEAALPARAPTPRPAAGPPAEAVAARSATAPADPAEAAAPPAAAAALTAFAAFREGWTALHARRYGDAVAAFDRARDPAIAEDAAYWAAIAAERGGDRQGAARRLEAFLATFPASARAAAARRARDQLLP
jgi:hypothetical protein